MVLHAGDDDLVAGPDVLAAVGLGDEVDGLGGAAHVDELVVLGGVDEAADLAAGGLVVVGGVLAQGVDAAMDVGILGRVVVDQRVNNALGLLAGGRVVQVDEGMSVDFLVENGEVLAQLFDIERVIGSGHDALPRGRVASGIASMKSESRKSCSGSSSTASMISLAKA